MDINGINLGSGPLLASSTALAALVLFGALYNRWVAGLEAQGHDRGYMAFIVAGGSLVALSIGGLLLGVLVGPQFGLLAWATMTLCFAASGLPMIIGSVGRHVNERARGERAWAGLSDWLTRLRGGENDQSKAGQDKVQTGPEPGGQGQSSDTP